MSKPEWGTKRICQGCGGRFYDLNRTQIVCPKCGTENNPEAPAKLRRAVARPVEPPRPAPPVAVAAASLVAEDVPPPDVVEDKDEEDKDEEENEVIEDASDLGEDEDDVAEVKEHIETEGGR